MDSESFVSIHVLKWLCLNHETVGVREVLTFFSFHFLEFW